VPLYDEDLAFAQAAGFGAFATNAAPGIVERLREAPIPIRRVIDVGCGAGVTTRALVDAGFDVLAVEPSPALIAIAQAAVPEASFHNASAYDVALGSADAILALGEPLTYHTPDVDAEATVARFFQSAATALPTGGLLIFDLICTGDPPLDAVGWKSDDDWAVLHRTIEDRSGCRIRRDIETFRRVGELYRRARETHHVRVFSPGAIRRSLEEAGFDVKTGDAYGTYALAHRRRAFFATRR
jgi:SAM-dependent methyltransferase